MLISKETETFEKLISFPPEKPMWSVFCQHIGAFVSCLEKSKTKCRLALPSHHKWNDWTPKTYHTIKCIQNVELQKSLHFNHMQISQRLQPKMNTQSINSFTSWFHNCSPHLNCMQYSCCSTCSSIIYIIIPIKFRMKWIHPNVVAQINGHNFVDNRWVI